MTSQVLEEDPSPQAEEERTLDDVLFDMADLAARIAAGPLPITSPLGRVLGKGVGRCPDCSTVMEHGVEFHLGGTKTCYGLLAWALWNEFLEWDIEEQAG